MPNNVEGKEELTMMTHGDGCFDSEELHLEFATENCANEQSSASRLQRQSEKKIPESLMRRLLITKIEYFIRKLDNFR
jgi:hypothetical protein